MDFVPALQTRCSPEVCQLLALIGAQGRSLGCRSTSVVTGLAVQGTCSNPVAELGSLLMLAGRARWFSEFLVDPLEVTEKMN